MMVKCDATLYKRIKKVDLDNQNQNHLANTTQFDLKIVCMRKALI